MNNIPNIVEIIKKAPMDHVYWCTICGPCKVKVNTSKDFPITVIGTAVERIIKLDSYGCYVDGYPTGDCVLFPSKGNRDWDSFNKDVNAGIIMREEAKGKYSDFDIAKAKNGSPVRTRDGHDARIICCDSQGGNYPIIALVKDETTESEIARYYNADGKSGIGISDLDLVMAPTHCEGYMAVLQDKSGNISFGAVYLKQEDATTELLSPPEGLKPIKTVKIEFDI